MRFFSGDHEGGLADVEHALEGARRTQDRPAEIRALTLLSHLRHGGYRNAIALGERAVAIAREIGDDRARANSLSRLAILDANRLRLDRALEEGREALIIARAHGDEEILGLALDGLKLAELKLGDLAAVEEHCAELVELHRRRGDAFYLSWALLESSEPHLGRGELEEALTLAEEAYELNRKLGDSTNEPVFLDTLCWIHRARGDYRTALELGRRARDRAIDLGHGEWQGWTSASLGWILLELRSVSEAAEVLSAGAGAARAVEATGEVLRCIGHLAWATWLQGERRQALALADEAERMIADITTPPGGAWLFGAHAQLGVARVRFEAGDRKAAGAIARGLLDAADRVGWPEPIAAAAVAAARCEEDAETAERLLVHGLEAADQAGRTAVSWDLRLELSRFPGNELHAAEARDLLEAVVNGLGEDPAAGTLAAAVLPAPAAG
jgi:tetratricopeptide (TPR) repeat protein